jgi:hypothetical protein
MSQLSQDKPNVVFQHDGAPPHIQNEVTTFLNKQLPELWIGRGGSTSLPPRSPDLTLLPRLFHVGLCERCGIRSANSYNPDELEGSNTNSVAKIDQPLLQNVQHEVEYCLDVCRTLN